MKITDIDIHRVTLQYDEARAYELIHYHDLTQRTIYVVRTDSGLTGLGESEGVEKQEVLDRYPKGECRWNSRGWLPVAQEDLLLSITS